MNTPTVIYVSGPSAHGLPAMAPAGGKVGQAPHLPDAIRPPTPARLI